MCVLPAGEAGVLVGAGLREDEEKRGCIGRMARTGLGVARQGEGRTARKEGGVEVER
jgi:hypothetical protein